MIRFLLFCSLYLFGPTICAQVGLAATPVKFYFETLPGENETQTITISNPTNGTVEVGVSFGDWKYNTSGNNQVAESGTLKTSAVDWIQVLPSSYFVLQPHERKQLEIAIAVPPHANKEIPVHTALVYFTQLNSGSGGVDANGAAIQVTVKMAVKVYHTFFENTVPLIEIVDFSTFENKLEKKALYLTLENQGKIWTDGKVSWELFNKNTGKKIKLEKTDFYTLPDDVHRIEKKLPTGLPMGDYTMTVIVKYDDSDVIKVAELAFSLKQSGTL